MKDQRSRVKRFLIIGSVAGGILSLSVFLLMDILYADALQGTWRDAIVRDLQNFFSVTSSPDSPVVYIIYIIILLVLIAFGALLGFVFSFFIHKFFLFLGSNDKQ
ncbi:MAG: hypothetical protein GXO95_01120 [Nitrospirae bacterium]|nr:hypothetical protein [Nitrospirota bacterium]